MVKEVSQLMKLHWPSSISHWEKGRKQPTLVNALWLSAVIGCPVEVLFMEHFNVIRAMVKQRRRKIKLKYPGF